MTYSINPVQKRINIYYYKLFAVMAVCISIFMHLTAYFEWMIYALRVRNLEFIGVSLGNMVTKVLLYGITIFTAFLLIYHLIKPFRPGKPFDLKFSLLTFLLAFVSVTFVSDLLFRIKNLIVGIPFPINMSLLYTLRDLMTTFSIIIVVFFIKHVKDKQEITNKNNSLIIENLERQYQSLKNQLSPHFFFNTITALKELIDEHPETARNYLSHLSSLMRYTLQSSENITVVLEEEIKELKSFMFLMKYRFNSSISLVEKIDSKYRNHKIPPLTLQTLVENAIKHNEISRKNNLKIEIQTTNKDSIIVSNKLRKKDSLEPSTGIGLLNISRQYKLLANKDINITRTNGEFQVEVPLIKP